MELTNHIKRKMNILLCKLLLKGLEFEKRMVVFIIFVYVVLYYYRVVVMTVKMNDKKGKKILLYHLFKKFELKK